MRVGASILTISGFSVASGCFVTIFLASSVVMVSGLSVVGEYLALMPVYTFSVFELSVRAVGTVSVV